MNQKKSSKLEKTSKKTINKPKKIYLNQKDKILEKKLLLQENNKNKSYYTDKHHINKSLTNFITIEQDISNYSKHSNKSQRNILDNANIDNFRPISVEKRKIKVFTTNNSKRKNRIKTSSVDSNILPVKKNLITFNNISININRIQNNSRSKSTEKSKQNIKSIIIKEDEEINLNPLVQNYNPNLYGFNLYKHFKENLRNKSLVCKEPLTKESYYCLDCKVSTCPK